MLLARITVEKVLDKQKLIATLALVPMQQPNPTWTCRIWVRDAIAALQGDGKVLGSSMTDWGRIEQMAKAFVSQKRQERRYDGSGNWQRGTMPTYDMLEDKETIP